MSTADTPVRLEVRLPGSRPSFHEVTAAEFLIGSVAGCDLVIPGAELPPVLGVICRTDDGPRLRRLAPNLRLTINGKIVQNAPLTNGDAIGIGSAEIRVHIPAMAAVPVAHAGANPGKPWTFNIPLGDRMTVIDRPIAPAAAGQQVQQESERTRPQTHDLDARQPVFDAEAPSSRENWADREQQLEAELEIARGRRRQAEQAANQRSFVGYADVDSRIQGLDDRETKLAADRATLDAEVRVHRDDLVRLERQRAALEARELDLSSREKHVENTTPLLDAKARQLELAEVQIRQDQERVRLGQSEIEVARANLAQKHAEVERQDGMLRALEDRLDRSRLDLTRHGQDLTEQKTRQDALERELALRQQQIDGRQADLALREETLARERQQLGERHQVVEATTTQVHVLRDQLLIQANEIKSREQKLTLERKTLDEGVRVHREDLARLDRFRESLETREKQLLAKSAEVDQQARQVELDLRAVEGKSEQTALAEQRLREEEERIRQLKADLEANTNALAERSANTEGQQAILVAVKAKLERLREELRVEAQALADQRARHETLERDFIEKQHAHDLQLAVLSNAHLEHTQAQQALQLRQHELAAIQRRLDEQRQKINADDIEIAKRNSEAEAREAEHIEQAASLREKAGQLLGLQQRIESDQHALVEREAALRDGESARHELQLQLMQRAEELAAKHQMADELARELAAQSARLTIDRQKVDGDLHVTRHELEARAVELRSLSQELQSREENCLRLVDRIKESGKSLAMERKQRHELKVRWENEHRRAAEDLVHTRGELERFKTEVLTQAEAVRSSLPDLEVRGTGALDRLVQAREQLKNHVAELHDYARQSYDDLEVLRNQVVSETERLREQQAGLAKARNDHRHTVTAFRQQLIDWQGKISDMKAGAIAGGLPVNPAVTDANAPDMDIEAASALIARPSPEQSDVFDQPITDMRDWFRGKLKQLAQTASAREPSAGATDGALILSGQFGGGPADAGKKTATSGIANVLAFTHELDPGDKKLGDVLRSLELADDQTLNVLWQEARRQRKSLRQVLLASGKLTVYQMALIEAGNLDGLTIGPLGVIDRLHVTPNESVYRVIDPRSGVVRGPVVLRHLSESANADAAKAHEFRQRFNAMVEIHHPHIVATIEVLELHDRPAALQEFLSGLPSAEWPSLAAVPGVWFRLACQSLLGLANAHQAGLVHGSLNAHSIVLTSDGLVKLTGIGEPAWLAGSNGQSTAKDDLVALGRLAGDWATLSPKRKLAKPPRPLPNAVRDILDRWLAGGYSAAHDVLDALDKAGGQVPAGTETWDRLMKFAGANATDGVVWRKSA